MESCSEKGYSEIEKILYAKVGFRIYGQKKVEFLKNPVKPDGIYFQYTNGCVLFCLINLGYLDENEIPDSMKNYKNHNYSQDEKTYKDYLKRVLSIIDLAQLWINLGGICPYTDKETSKVIELEEIRKKAFDILKENIDAEKFEDAASALKIVQNLERFAITIGNIPIKKVLLSEIMKEGNLCLKSAIESGIIKKDSPIFCLNHFIAFNGVVEENEKKYYLFSDSLPIYFHVIKPETKEGSEFDDIKGKIKSTEEAALINICETPEKQIGILQLNFLE